MTNQTYSSNEYFKALNLDQDPFQDIYTENSFFTTPELQHRLDLARHLLEFSQQILLIKGLPKAGKTTFSRHLISNSDTAWQVCRVDATEEMGPDVLIKVMLQDQLENSEGNTETITILNNYLTYCKSNNKTPVIFVDDADQLSQSTLRFIFQLMEFKEEDTYVRVVLIGQDSFVRRLNEVTEEKSSNGLIHTINIPPFSLEETVAYLQHRLKTYGGREDMFSDKEVSRIHKVSGGMAGNINFLARQGLSDPAVVNLEISSSQTSSKTNSNVVQIGKIVFASLVLTIVVVTLWSNSREQKQIGTETISINLPPESIVIEENVGDKPVQAEIEILPDAWLDSQSPESLSVEVKGQKEIGSIDLPVASVVIESNKQDEIEQTPEIVPVHIEDVEPGSEVLATARETAIATDMKGHEWLLAQPANSFVLQLIGAVEMETITRFLQEAQLDRSQLALYNTQKSARNWYVLVYGLYSERELARAAIATLSSKAQEEKPWPKAVAGIHEAIKSP